MTVQLIALLLSLRIIGLPYAVQEMSLQAGVVPMLAKCIIEAESQWDVNRLPSAVLSEMMLFLVEQFRWWRENGWRENVGITRAKIIGTDIVYQRKFEHRIRRKR